MIAILLVLAGGLIGCAMIRAGLREYLVDDNPSCSACGYDLRGRPADSQRCSECGADLDEPNAVIIGHFRLDWQQVLVGGVLSCAAFGLGMALIRRQLPSIDWQALKPSWVVQGELDHADPTVRAVARQELLRRMAAGKLSDDRLADIVSTVLKRQREASVSRPYLPVWGDMLIAARRANRVGDSTWNTFLQQGLKIELQAFSAIHSGDPLPVRLKMHPPRLGSGQVSPRLYWRETSLGTLTVSGQQIKPIGRHPVLNPPLIDVPGFAGDATSKLVPGLHTLEVNGWLDMVLPEVTGRMTVPVAVSSRVTVAEADAPIERFIVNEAERRYVEASVRLYSIQAGERAALLTWSLTDTPIALASSVAVRLPGGQEISIGTLVTGESRQTRYPVMADLDLAGISKVDVILRPDRQVANEQPGAALRWGDTIVLGDIPVQRRTESRMAPPRGGR